MIALASPLPVKHAVPRWHERFLAMVPAIQRYARISFRDLNDEAQDDALVEAVANALIAYVVLYRQGREELAYPTVLARYAVAQFRAGRRVGNRMNGRDVFAPRAQRRHRFAVERLSELVPDRDSDEWIAGTIEDTKTSVPDQAAFRCDFPRWLAKQDTRKRRIAEALAAGHSTRDVARRFGVSPGRISQLRSELHKSWHKFHGGSTDAR